MAISAMGNDVAAEAAGLSGGESLDFADKHSFENDIGILSNHIANRYTLSFRPTSNQPGLHSIGVSLKGHSEMTVEASQRYWAAEAKLKSRALDAAFLLGDGSISRSLRSLSTLRRSASHRQRRCSPPDARPMRCPGSAAFTGERCSSHASDNWLTVAPCFLAASSSLPPGLRQLPCGDREPGDKADAMLLAVLQHIFVLDGRRYITGSAR